MTNTNAMPAFLGGQPVAGEILSPASKTNAIDVAKSLIADTEVKTTFRTAATKGAVDSTASRQWASRPDDEKYLSLTDMRTAIEQRFRECRTVELSAKELTFDEHMHLGVGDYGNLELTNWTYNQLCEVAKAPLNYIKQLPNELAAQCLALGVEKNAKNESIKVLLNADKKQLRAITSTTYGRVWDYQMLDEVMKIAGNGVNDTNWKVPGAIDWNSGNGVTFEYNPFVDVTKETTTLYASDRDMFLFLVDDTHPIEVGKLSNGEPDLMFRGFYITNSETGAGTLEVNCMMMRGVCANRNIWGVENSVKLRHSIKAPEKFGKQVFPMLAAYAMSTTVGVINKVRAAKQTIIATNDEERMDFLTGSKVGLWKGVASDVMLKCMQEEQHPIASVWDAVQGITAYARTIPLQNERTALELKAGKLMDKLEA